MRWPWVAREALEAVERHNEALRAALAREAERVDLLTARLGAEPPRVVEVARPAPAPTVELPPILREEVQAIAGNERGLSRILTAKAWALWDAAERKVDLPTLSAIRHQLRFDEVMA